MFIQVNGRYFDKTKYYREVLLLKRLAEYEISESLKKYGFEHKGKIFVHEQYGLRLKLLFEESEQKPL